MAHGLSLVLREIKSERLRTPSKLYVAKHCFGGPCLSGKTDRASRRNERFKRGRFRV